MNDVMKRILEDAEVIFDNPDAHVPLALVSMEDFKLITELIVEECYRVVVSNPHNGTSLAGANMMKHFGMDNNIAAAEQIHSDKGYSLGTPEAQKAFDSKRGYKL
jgi:hypothetical protein